MNVLQQKKVFKQNNKQRKWQFFTFIVFIANENQFIFHSYKKKTICSEKRNPVMKTNGKKTKKKEFFERIFNFFNEVNFIGLLILISYWKKKEQKIIVLSALWLANKNVDFKMKLNKTNISVPIATHLNINACPSKWSKHLSGKKT